MKYIIDHQAKGKLVFCRDTLVGKHSTEMFLVVGHQDCTWLRRDFGPKSFWFLGCFETQSFSSLHRFTIGLRSKNLLGHSMTLIWFLLSNSFVALAVCFGLLACWNTHSRHIFRVLAESFIQDFNKCGTVHWHLNLVKSPCTVCTKNTPKHNVLAALPPKRCLRYRHLDIHWQT